MEKITKKLGKQAYILYVITGLFRFIYLGNNYNQLTEGRAQKTLFHPGRRP